MSEEQATTAPAPETAASAPAGKRVLVLGCGDHELYGNLRHEFTRPGSRDTVALAHDLNDLPWPWGDGVFDEISGAGVVEQLRLEPDVFLGECGRLLAKGGRLFLIVGDGHAKLTSKLVRTAERAGWRSAGVADGGTVELVKA